MAYNPPRNTKNRSGLILVLAVVLSLIAGAAAGGVAGGIAGYTLAGQRTPQPQVVTLDGSAPAQEVGRTQAAPAQLSVQESSDTVDAMKKAGPAVVTVITTLQSSSGQQRTQVAPTASGSGIILDKNGHILTNNHVIEGQQKVTVIFANGDQADAKLVGADTIGDLAVLKVNGPVPAVAELGDSDALLAGQHVLAIGSALGDFRNSVTEGIISGLGRRLPGVDYRIDDLIQTDAAINHGNSGGPLVNLAGQVVGINVAIYRGTGTGEDATVEGVGFAIPIGTAKLVADQLIATGKVVRPYVGVSYQMLTPQLASYYKTAQQQGAYVTNVAINTPGSRAGLQEQDVITAIGDRQLNDSYSLFSALLRYHPGDTVQMKLMRGDKDMTVTVTLIERPDSLQ